MDSSFSATVISTIAAAQLPSYGATEHAAFYPTDHPSVSATKSAAFGAAIFLSVGSAI